MKKLILLTLLLFVGFSLSAQDMPEIVYLKNGNLIRGTIIQMIPDESLEIKSRDGKVYVYQMSEVLRIEKNMSAKVSADKARPVSNYSDSYTSRSRDEFVEPAYYSSDSYSLNAGYRGMFDLGYSVSVDAAELNRLEFSTSHGYQFNPYLYLGIGGGASFYYDKAVPSTVSFPVFINPRVDFSTGKVSPFIDLKGGYTFGEYVEGLYISPSIGARFVAGSGLAVNFTMAYTLQQVEIYENYYTSTHINIGAITFKIGFDF